MKKNIFSSFLFLSINSLLLCKEEANKVVFAHGLEGSFQKQGRYYDNLLFSPLFMRDNIHKFELSGPNFPENFDKKQVSLCQNPESLLLNSELKKITKPVILYGVSRGAALVFTSKMYDPDSHKHVVARIVESPFSSFEGLLKKHQLYGWLPTFITKSLFLKIAAPNADLHGMDPLKAVSQFCNDQIPTLFICSESDQLISWKDTKELADALRACGNKNVHLIVLRDGQHAQLLHNSSESHLYREAVEQFLNKYIHKKEGEYPLLIDTYRQSEQEKPTSYMHGLSLFYKHHMQTICLCASVATIALLAYTGYMYKRKIKKNAS